MIFSSQVTSSSTEATLYERGSKTHKSNPAYILHAAASTRGLLVPTLTLRQVYCVFAVRSMKKLLLFSTETPYSASSRSLR